MRSHVVQRPTGPLVVLLLAAGCSREERVLLLDDDPSVTFDPGTGRFREGTVAQLFEQLESGTVEERSFAAISLGYAQHGFTCIPSIYSVPTVEERRRTQPQAGIRPVGARARVIVPRLVSALRDPAPEVRRAAARALGFMHDHAREACDALRSASADPDAYTGLAASLALYEITLEPREALERFVTALQHADDAVRETAVSHLSDMRGDARAAIPALERAAQDADERVRAAAGRVLEVIR